LDLFCVAGLATGRFIYTTTQGKDAAFKRALANTRTPPVLRSFVVLRLLIETIRNEGRKRGDAFPGRRPGNQPVIT
jgi:hypothetical protein